MLLYWSWRLTVFLRRLVPTELCYGIALLVAEFFWLFILGPKREVIKGNLARVLESGDPRRLTRMGRRVYRNYCRLAVDFLRFPTLSPRQVDQKFLTNRWPWLHEALARGRGALFVSIHMGNWDLAGGAVAQQGVAMTIITEGFSNPHIQRLVVETRARLGVTVVPIGQPLAAARALKRNEVLGLLIDRPFPESGGVAVEFFGAPTVVPEGPARLAQRTGAAIFVVGMYRHHRDAYAAIVTPAIYPEPAEDEDAVVASLTQEMMTRFEGMIRAHPEQWFMYRPFWGPAPHCDRDVGQLSLRRV